MNDARSLQADLAFAARAVACLAGLLLPAAGFAAGAPDGDTIIVTGSRIVRPGLAAPGPVAVISAAQIAATNTVTVEQILSTNPQFAPGSSGASNNPGDGAATVDLRGLGAKRTLVLVDGQRLPYYDAGGAVDLNLIPTVLIKNIQVLTGGASAVYGSDAIAGVVNVVLDDRFTGVRIDSGAQITGHGDGATRDISAAAGFTLGTRGHFVVAGNWARRDSVTLGQRAFSSSVLCSNDNASFCGSTNTTPSVFDIPGIGSRQVTPAGALDSTIQGYNYNPVNYAQIPLDRYGATALWHYDLTDDVAFKGRALVQHTKVVTALAPTATAGIPFVIDPANPLLSAGERAAFFDTSANPDLFIMPDGSSVIGIRRRIVETGARIETHTTTTWQIAAGLHGRIGADLTWDASAAYAEVRKFNLLTNDLYYPALAQALDVVPGPSGQAQCRNAGARAAGCVPLNVFATAPLAPAALGFVLRDATEAVKTSQFVAEAGVTGDLRWLTSPLAKHPAAMAAGFAYRRETSDTAVNSDYASGYLIYYGQGANIPGKSYDVKEAWLETRMPLVEDRPGLRRLAIEAGYRYAHYSSAGGASAFKFGGEWSPLAGLTLHGGWQRAVRAPNFAELDLPHTAGIGNLGTDPCAGSGLAAPIAKICLAQGAPLAAIGQIPAPDGGQINAFYGGNPNLKPERARTITVGTVIAPMQLRALTLGADYYDIRIANAIVAAPTALTINQCFVIERDPNGPACRRIVRNPLDGSLSGDPSVGVPAFFDNVAVLRTRGIDVNLAWRGGDPARFQYAFDFRGTRQITAYQIVNGQTVQCVGRFGASCDTPTPKWKHLASLTVGWPKITLATRWRMIGGSAQDSSTNILTARIPSVHYWDETATFALTKAIDLSVGVLNLADREPPIIGDTSGAASSAGSTFPTTYDMLGRTFFVRATARL